MLTISTPVIGQLTLNTGSHWLMRSTWSSLLKDLTLLPGSERRVFTDTNQTTDTWEVDQSITTTALLR